MEPRCDCGCFAPGVRDLDTDFLALGVREVDDGFQGANVRVGPDTRVLGRYAAFWEDGCGFHYGETGPAGDDAADWEEEIG